MSSKICSLNTTQLGKYSWNRTAIKHIKSSFVTFIAVTNPLRTSPPTPPSIHRDGCNTVSRSQALGPLQPGRESLKSVVELKQLGGQGPRRRNNVDCDWLHFLVKKGGKKTTTKIHIFESSIFCCSRILASSYVNPSRFQYEHSLTLASVIINLYLPNRFQNITFPNSSPTLHLPVTPTSTHTHTHTLLTPPGRFPWTISFRA